MVSAATARRNLADVVGLLRFAAKKLNSGVPVPDVEPVVIPRKIPVAWTVRHVSALLRVCQSLTGRMKGLPIERSSWWTALILLCYDTGARVRAALSVTVGDVDLDSRIVVLVSECSKTGVEQVCDIGQDTCQALIEVIRQQTDEGMAPGLLLPYPWRHRKLWLELQEIIRLAGVPGGRYVGFHRLRKTHATQRVIHEGWDAARQALGHANQKMTERYVDLRQLPRSGTILPRPK